MKKILLDTNVLLTEPELVDKNPEKYAICLTTLRELDKLKRNPELSYSVRRAIKSIFFNLNKLTIDINETIDYENLTNDEKIIISAKNNNWKFKTEDIGAMVIANSVFDVVLDTDLKEEMKYQHYKGYKEHIVKDLEKWTKLYHTSNADKELINMFGKDLNLNEYKILFNEDKTQYIIIFKNKDSFISQVPLKKYKKIINNVGIRIKPLDAYQWIALDSVLNDNPISIIDGRLGTGKTLMVIIGALISLHSNHEDIKKYKKIYISRPPIEIDKRYKQGYLPGELDNKMEPWLLSFKSNLEFIYNINTKDNLDDENNYGEEIFKKDFSFVSLEHIQGASIHDTIFLVDEYQLLDANMLKQILSRIAAGSKIILMGDPEGQTYNINRGHEGYRVLRKHIKNQKLLSYVKLNKIYRSELAEFVEMIFD